MSFKQLHDQKITRKKRLWSSRNLLSIQQSYYFFTYILIFVYLLIVHMLFLPPCLASLVSLILCQKMTIMIWILANAVFYYSCLIWSLLLDEKWFFLFFLLNKIEQTSKLTLNSNVLLKKKTSTVIANVHSFSLYLTSNAIDYLVFESFLSFFHLHDEHLKVILLLF